MSFLKGILISALLTVFVFGGIFTWAQLTSPQFVVTETDETTSVIVVLPEIYRDAKIKIDVNNQDGSQKAFLEEMIVDENIVYVLHHVKGSCLDMRIYLTIDENLYVKHIEVCSIP